jgi:hypothetical protein
MRSRRGSGKKHPVQQSPILVAPHNCCNEYLDQSLYVNHVYLCLPEGSRPSSVLQRKKERILLDFVEKRAVIVCALMARLMQSIIPP